MKTVILMVLSFLIGSLVGINKILSIAGMRSDSLHKIDPLAVIAIVIFIWGIALLFEKHKHERVSRR